MPRRDSTADYAILAEYRATMGEFAAAIAKAQALLQRLAELDPPCLTPPR